MNEMLNPSSMVQMGQVPLFMMGEAYDWMNRAKGADAASLEEVMKERQRKEQLHGLDVQQRGATLEGVLLGNQEKQLGLEYTRATQPKKIDTELLKLMSEADETEWKDTVRKIEKGVLENNPQALKLYEQLPKIREERLKHKQDMEKEKEQTQRAYGVAQIGADSREQAARLRNQAATGGRMPKSPRELMTYYTAMANTEEDETIRNELLAKAEAEWQKVLQEEVAKAQARAAGTPTLNFDPATGKPIGLTQRPTPDTGNMPRAQSPKTTNYTPVQKDWIQRAMKANPGMTEQQVIEQGRKLGKL